MPDKEDLRRILSRIDGRGFKAYKDIAGQYDFGGFTLYAGVHGFFQFFGQSL